MRVHRMLPKGSSLVGFLASAIAMLPAMVTVRAADNSPPPGFVALFDGVDLAGWKGLVEPKGGPPARAKLSPEALAEAQAKADASMREHWKAADGMLVYDGHGESLCTAKDYGDFELLVDWKIPAGGDSGVYLRGTPQVQIWDTALVKVVAQVGSGGLYNNKNHPNKPLAKADKPVGEWNTFHIRMVGDKVTVRLNDQLVVDQTPLENYWQRDQPLPATGQIELQNHGGPLYFKNIYLKELP